MMFKRRKTKRLARVIRKEAKLSRKESKLLAKRILNRRRHGRR